MEAEFKSCLDAPPDLFDKRGKEFFTKWAEEFDIEVKNYRREYADMGDMWLHEMFEDLRDRFVQYACTAKYSPD